MSTTSTARNFFDFDIEGRVISCGKYGKLKETQEEAYRVLRTNIQFCNIDKDIKTLTITSCTPNEGKSTTSISLAISMAKSGMKVLVVDADLHKPGRNKPFGYANPRGLSNYISGTAALSEVVNRTDIEGFYYVSCGPKPPNPAELVGSGRFAEFLDLVKADFDMVIIDTPPLGGVIDAAIIASRTDASLMVIQPKMIAYRQAQRVKEQLEKANVRVIGIVFNKVKKTDFKNYYNYYYYYGKEGRSKKGWLRRLIKG